MRQREQFHAHGGDFAKFDRRVAVIDQRLFACRQRVKRVAAFVHQRAQVVVAADRIHEDERQAALLERALVAAGSLAFAIFELEQAVIGHELELLAEGRMHARKDFLGAADEIGRRREWGQRRTIERVHAQVPRTQRIQFEQLLAARANLSGQRHHGALDALVEAKAILSCVVEAFALAESEVAIVRKARVGGHLRPQRHQLVVDLFQGVLVFQTARGHFFPDLLAQGAVGLLQDLGGLLQSHLGAVDADGHCAHQLVVVLGQQLVLRFERNILFAEQRHRSWRICDPARRSAAAGSCAR